MRGAPAEVSLKVYVETADHRRVATVSVAGSISAIPNAPTKLICRDEHHPSSASIVTGGAR
jgi:hypothetical protein